MTFLTATLCLLLVFAGFLFEPVSGSVAIWLAGIAAIAVSGFYHGERTEIMRALFSGRLSEPAFNELVAQNNPAALTGRRELTALCFRVLNHPELAHETDGVKFEQISARMQRSVSEFIVSRGGYLDDADAQSLQALFGFPVADEHHALHASQVAAALRPHLSALASEIEQVCGTKPRFGVALATGAFDPPTPCSHSRCATRLRNTPLSAETGGLRFHAELRILILNRIGVKPVFHSRRQLVSLGPSSSTIPAACNKARTRSASAQCLALRAAVRSAISAPIRSLESVVVISGAGAVTLITTEGTSMVTP